MPGDWEKDWEMILSGGPPLWKDGEKYVNYKMTYDMLVEQGAVDPAKPLRIFVPLAGDGAICPYFYHKGNSMVASEVCVMFIASNRRGRHVDMCWGPEYFLKGRSKLLCLISAHATSYSADP
jgi:hypothetical protein